MGCHGSTSIDGSLVTATRVLTVWSRGHDDRIPIRSALPRRWRSGSSRYAASSPRQGLDHGPQTIGWHLEQQHLPVPSTSTIRRILVAAGLVTAEPRKRPKSSYRRFEADQPNECWQSDFTHWQLADGAGVEIINWLDDHSRYLLASRVYPRITGPIVISTSLTTAEAYGLPHSTLTDNGSVYTSRFTGGRNGFEYLIANLGITQKNGHPNHPQTTKHSSAGSPLNQPPPPSPNCKPSSTASSPSTTSFDPTGR
jgi:transposase InsO family protein